MCVFFFLFLIIPALITFSLDLSVSLSPLHLSSLLCCISFSLTRLHFHSHTDTYTSLSISSSHHFLSLKHWHRLGPADGGYLLKESKCTLHAQPQRSSLSLSFSLYLKEKELYFGVLFFLFVFLPAIGNYAWGEKEGFWIRFWVLVLCGGSGCDVGVLSNARVNLFLLKRRGFCGFEERRQHL